MQTTLTAPRPCPGCGQRAPIVLRGVTAFCTVCGARRAPFASSVLNVAGKPARVGGKAARVLGWSVLFGGLFLALTVGFIVQALASLFVATTWLGWAVGVPIAVASVGVAIFGIVGGRRLGRAGESTLREAQLEIIRGLARHQRGIVKAGDVARSLDVDVARADAILTALAGDPKENIALDVDDDGNVLYLFGSAEAIRWRIKAEHAGITDTDREVLEQAELDAVGKSARAPGPTR